MDIQLLIELFVQQFKNFINICDILQFNHSGNDDQYIAIWNQIKRFYGTNIFDTEKENIGTEYPFTTLQRYVDQYIVDNKWKQYI